jgi:hypothetical protein
MALACPGMQGAAVAQQAQRVTLPSRKPVSYLKVQGLQLFLGKLPFRNVGVNLPGLFEQYLAGKDGASTLQAIAKLGALFVRCPVAPASPAELARFQGDHASWLGAFDRMLSDAQTAGLTVVPILLASPTAFGNQLYTAGSPAEQASSEYVTAIVSAHTEDPRVLFWEISDEMNLLSAAPDGPTADQVHDLLVRIARLIKRVDRRHPVSSGNADIPPTEWHRIQAARAASGPPAAPLERDTFDQYTQMLDLYNPNPLDFISIHVYQPTDPASAPLWMIHSDNHAFTAPWSSYAASTLKKPLFIGAFKASTAIDGKGPATDWEADLLRRIVQQAIAPVAAVLAWEPAPPSGVAPPVLTPLEKLLTDANSQIQVAIVSEAIDTGVLPAPAQPVAPKGQGKPAKPPPAQPP